MIKNVDLRIPFIFWSRRESQVFFLLEEGREEKNSFFSGVCGLLVLGKRTFLLKRVFWFRILMCSLVCSLCFLGKVLGKIENCRYPTNFNHSQPLLTSFLCFSLLLEWIGLYLGFLFCFFLVCLFVVLLIFHFVVRFLFYVSSSILFFSLLTR